MSNQSQNGFQGSQPFITDDEYDSDEYDIDMEELNFSFTASDLEDVLKTFA